MVLLVTAREERDCERTSSFSRNRGRSLRSKCVLCARHFRVIMSDALLLDSASAVRLPVPAGKPVQRDMPQNALLEASHRKMSKRLSSPLGNLILRCVMSVEIVAPVEGQDECSRRSQLTTNGPVAGG